MDSVTIDPSDNVEVLLKPRGGVRAGHKVALCDIPRGGRIVKYGFPIAVATRDIAKGEWVHVHNAATALDGSSDFRYDPESAARAAAWKTDVPGEIASARFMGYRRKKGRPGTRNEIWIVPAVGCVNSIAMRLAENARRLVSGPVEGVKAFPHQFGCSQTGEDHARTRRLLAALCRHPNAGGVLVVSLGCENLTPEQFRGELGDFDPCRVKFLVCQEIGDEIAEGERLLAEIADAMKDDRREECPAADLVAGLKCGGSDGLSGITANPVVGRFSDLLVACGGTAVLTEIPEMFGAERMLLGRAASREAFDRAAGAVVDFKGYFLSHGEKVSENPSPGNRDGGITTLEDKSCGCVQKGGTSPVVDAVGYACPVSKSGLNIMSGPGNDLVSATALAASGAQVVLFTTGRGTPFGAPVPTLKISTNTALAGRKPHWIDFDAGTVAEGAETVDGAARRLYLDVMAVASGRRTKAEEAGASGIAVFKDGVVL